MAFDPYTFSTKRMGAHVYHVEDLDLSAWGFPGVTFEGDVDIDIEGDDDDAWYIGAVHALDGGGRVHQYDTHQGVGEAVVAALYADTRHSQLIEDACWYHGED
jgi:hypothetical protein